MSDWSVMTLGEICAEGGGFIRTGPFGSQLHQSDYVDDERGIPVVMPKDMAHGRVDRSTIARIGADTVARLSHHLLAAGDIALSRRGDVGRSAWIGPEDLPVLCGTGSMRVHPGKPRSVDPSYLRYFFRSRLAIDYLEAQAVGATMPNLNAQIVTGMPVPVLPMSLQRIAAEVLRSIDDLIANNRRRVEVLEEMARVIYREWFVHLRYPGYEDAPPVDSRLGPIPDGWTVRPLVEVAELTMGQSPKSEFYNSQGVGKPFHQGVADFGRHHPTHRKFCTVDTRVAQDGDVLVSVRAPVGRINVADTTLVIGRGLAAVRSTTGQQSFLLATLREVFAEEDSMGGGTIFNAIGKSELEQIPVLQPPCPLAMMVNDRLESKFRLIRSLTFAGRELVAIRDLLLPKLVTGKVDVSHLDLDSLSEPAMA